MSLKSALSQAGNWIAGKASQFTNWLGERWRSITAPSQEYQLKLSKDLAQYQQNMQAELYEKYSSPAAIMKQLEDAGLNPNLAYGGATSGQSHAPDAVGVQAPRYMSGAEAFNTALSAIASIQGIQTARYQVQAARESAEQSAVKTLNDMINYRRNARDYEMENTTMGYRELTPIARMFRKLRGNVNVEGLFDGSPNPELDAYIGAARNKYFAEAARPGVQNRKDAAAAYIDEVTGQYLPEYLAIRNQQSQLNYDVDNDFKKATAFGNAAGPFLQFLSGLIRKFLK